jgi:glutaminase
MLMGIASTLIGVLPGHGSIGFWSPTLLVLLRLDRASASAANGAAR